MRSQWNIDDAVDLRHGRLQLLLFGESLSDENVSSGPAAHICNSSSPSEGTADLSAMLCHDDRSRRWSLCVNPFRVLV